MAGYFDMGGGESSMGGGLARLKEAMARRGQGGPGGFGGWRQMMHPHGQQQGPQTWASMVPQNGPNVSAANAGYMSDNSTQASPGYNQPSAMPPTSPSVNSNYFAGGVAQSAPPQAVAHQQQAAAQTAAMQPSGYISAGASPVAAQPLAQTGYNTPSAKPLPPMSTGMIGAAGGYNTQGQPPAQTQGFAYSPNNKPGVMY